MDTDTAWNLGVIFDSDFRFDQQMNSVVKSSSYKLWAAAKKKEKKNQTSPGKSHSRFHLINPKQSTAVPISALAHLQLVARLLIGTRKRAHVTPILTSLQGSLSSTGSNLRFFCLFLKFLMG